MKISYVMIVLNGMPYIKANLEGIYESAHEIIIVEGAEQQGMFSANPDGSSNDGTVEFIKAFPDPDKKIKLVQGKWPFKLDMQNHAVEIATGDYIWLVDFDEIYKKEDIKKITQMLINDPTIYQINVPLLHFWKGYNWILDTTVVARASANRIFKLQKPCYFSTHRPPTMFYPNLQKETVRKSIKRRQRNLLNVIDYKVLEKQGIYIYHYSYVLEKQVWQKMNLYKTYGWEKPWKMNLLDWYENCFRKWSPETRVEIEKKYTIIPCAEGSNTKPFVGTHPTQMKTIMEGTQ